LWGELQYCSQKEDLKRDWTLAQLMISMVVDEVFLFSRYFPFQILLGSLGVDDIPRPRSMSGIIVDGRSSN
jgi:hypothetical protein